MGVTGKSICVHMLVCVFGIGSWVDINGVWVELPIMVRHLPEGWNLGSYLVIIIQLANVGPLAVTLLALLKPSRMKEKPVVYIILIIGAVACLLLAFLWDRVTVVSGEEHSLALLVLQFFLALVDCTSSVVFLPFMAIFKSKYMATYFVGEGLSGLLPSLLALIQGAGAVECVPVQSHSQNISDNRFINETLGSFYPKFLPPRFPVRTFFIFLFSMMVACCIAFIILNHHPFCRSEKVAQSKTKEIEIISSTNSTELVELHSTAPYRVHENGFSNDDTTVCTTTLLDGSAPADRRQPNSLTCPLPDVHLSKCVYIYYLFLTAWMNALSNAVLPSVQSYSCLPYGIGPYHLAVILSSISNPLACCFAFVLQTKSNLIISTLAISGTVFSGYIILTALLSPSPYLVNEQSGEIIMVTVWVLTVLCLSYAKVSIGLVFHAEGKKALLWCGVVTQIGSAVGAIILFVLINVGNFFTSAPMCS